MRIGEPLPRGFYVRNIIDVAKELFGNYLVRKNFDGESAAIGIGTVGTQAKKELFYTLQTRLGF